MVAPLQAKGVERAIQSVRPFAVDVCTGIRTDGAMDEDKLILFMKAVSAAG